METKAWVKRLLRLFPSDFRNRYGDEILEYIVDAERERSIRVPWRMHLLLGWDLLRTICVAWLTTFRNAVSRVRGESGRMERMRQDIRFALRTLRKNPGFSIVVIVTLALGIGANTAVFTIVNEILLRSLPIGKPENVVDLHVEIPGGNSFTGFSYGDYVDYEARNDVLTGLAAFMGARVTVGSDDNVPLVSAQFSSANYFEVLEVTPQLGRAFLFDEGVRGSSADVAVISHRYWQRVGGGVEIIGSTITVNDAPVLVVGVAPPGFEGTFIGFPIDMWLPLSSMPRLLANVDFDDRTLGLFELIGRVKPGMTDAHSSQALNLIAEQLEREHPVANRGRRVSVTHTTGLDNSMRRGVTAFLAVLTGIAMIVLLVTCLNVSGLMLARSTGRRKEMVIRLAMGAGRWRLIRQMLTEASILFALGGLAGAYVASRLTDALLLLVARLPVPLGFHLPIDWRVLLYTASIALLTALVAGVIPARDLWRHDPASALRTREEEGRAGKLRRLFVVGQIAGAVVLLVCGGLFARSLLRGTQLDLGFDADRVAVTSVDLPHDQYDGERAEAFWDLLQERVRRVPGIESAALAARRPLGVSRTPVQVRIPGYQPPDARDVLTVDGNFVDDAYFETVGIDLVGGRGFRREDVVRNHPVAIVNTSMAARFWPGREPIGQPIVVEQVEYTVIGVARDSRYFIQDDIAVEYVYFPRSVRAFGGMQLVVRATGDVAALNEELHAVVETLDASLAVPALTTLREVMNAALLPQRLAVAVTGSLGLFGFFLAALGVYGVLAHAVAKRTREMGVRLALGSQRSTVLALVIRDGMKLVVTGVVGGLILALLVSPLISQFLVDVQPYDPITFAAVATSFLIVSLIACYAPARKATNIDPASVLRAEG